MFIFHTAHYNIVMPKLLNWLILLVFHLIDLDKIIKGCNVNCLLIIGYNMEIMISSARIVCIMLKWTLHVYSNSSFGIVSLHYCIFCCDFVL